MTMPSGRDKTESGSQSITRVFQMHLRHIAAAISICKCITDMLSPPRRRLIDAEAVAQLNAVQPTEFIKFVRDVAAHGNGE